jgi:hypothetical protein
MNYKMGPLFPGFSPSFISSCVSNFSTEIEGCQGKQNVVDLYSMLETTNHFIFVIPSIIHFPAIALQLTVTVRFEFYVYKNTSRMFTQQATGIYIPVCTLQFYLVDRK